MPGTLNPYALYVHIPWCVKKCPYCDFNSHESAGKIDETAYLKALMADFESELGHVAHRPVSSVFFGGGTPSLLSAGFYTRLLEKIAALTVFSETPEITLEANPGTADADHFKGYRQAGINRLSLGMQSLNDTDLHNLGRIHNGLQAQNAFEIARAAGFDNINIDLMFGLPGQDINAALGDLSAVLNLNPEHLSWYQLTLEPNTLFYARPPANLPDTELAWEMQNAGNAMLAENKLKRYEISAYAKPGYECRHNLNYWHYGDYLGIGAGAHGKYHQPDSGFTRTTKQRHPGRYLAGEYLSNRKTLTRDDVVAEFFINRLRLFSPFSVEEFCLATGASFESIRQPLNQALEKKLIAKQKDNYQPTLLGYQFLNDLISQFL